MMHKTMPITVHILYKINLNLPVIILSEIEKKSVLLIQKSELTHPKLQELQEGSQLKRCPQFSTFLLWMKSEVFCNLFKE